MYMELGNTPVELVKFFLWKSQEKTEEIPDAAEARAALNFKNQLDGDLEATS